MIWRNSIYYVQTTKIRTTYRVYVVSSITLGLAVVIYDTVSSRSKCRQ